MHIRKHTPCWTRTNASRIRAGRTCRYTNGIYRNGWTRTIDNPRIRRVLCQLNYAPRAETEGFEPSTRRLTAACSTAELRLQSAAFCRDRSTTSPNDWRRHNVSSTGREDRTPDFLFVRQLLIPAELYRHMELRRIELRFRVCKTRVFPLDDNPETLKTGADPAISSVTGRRLCCLSS